MNHMVKSDEQNWRDVDRLASHLPRKGRARWFPNCARYPNPPFHFQGWSSPSSIARVEREPSNSLYLSFRGVAEAALYCARHSHPPNPERAETRSCPEASTVSPCAFCEQEGHLAAPFPIL